MANTNKTKEKNKGTRINNIKKERKGVLGYLIGVRQELKKVVWPDRKELSSNTALVFIVCAFFATVFWLVDTGFLAVLREILGVSLS